MDILIKNIKMPKSCEVCFACEEFSYESFDYCNILKAPTTRGERRKDCPLVALPEHGDLVEISKVKEALCIHGQASPWERYVPVIVEASNE